MKLHDWSQVPEEQLAPQLTRQMIHGANMTISRLRIQKGFVVPTHSHVNEQITTIEKGSVVFITPVERVTVRAGESLVVPPNVPHSVECLEDALAVDIFAPLREDWIRGDDAYLRK